MKPVKTFFKLIVADKNQPYVGVTNIICTVGIITVLIVLIMHSFVDIPYMHLFFLLSLMFMLAAIAVIRQNYIHAAAQKEAKAAAREINRQDELLRVINSAAHTLLSANNSAFKQSLQRNMGMLGKLMYLDRIYVWRRQKSGGKYFYRQIYEWLATADDAQHTVKTKMGHVQIDGISAWDASFLQGEVINGPFASLSLHEQERLGFYKIKSLLVIPVTVGNVIWGFVSFDDCHQERYFSPAEVDILRSGSLLLANAIRHNELTGNLLKAREKALTSTRAKTDFLSNMSHEIRTPLNVITGMTTIAKNTCDLERKDYCLGKISDSSQHLLGIVNNILDISKIEAGKLELAEVEFSFEKMLQKAVNVVSFRVDEKKQHLRIDLDKDIPPYLLSDDQRLTQVVTNLLANAVKFTPHGGSIWLSTRLLQEDSDGFCTIQISIKDSGIGISEEQQAHLFNAYQQADRHTARHYGGTGLGLAISKKIVAMLGGRIWVESELGKGADFAFVFRAQKSQATPALCSWGNLRVLAVDAEPESLQCFTFMAERFGFTCATAQNGKGALTLLRENPPYDLYFVNWQIADMESLDLFRSIRERDKEHPIITMLSATELTLITEEARELGISSFLAKPLFPSAVVDCINESLGIEQATSHGFDGQDDFSGYCLLLVEDVEINREIVTTLLEPTGITIDCAGSGEMALDMFTDNPGRYSLIFMDLQMPELDGFETTVKLRALPLTPAQTVPIIAMTANVFQEDIKKCLSVGMNDHIGKPLVIAEMLAKMRKYMLKTAVSDFQPLREKKAGRI